MVVQHCSNIFLLGLLQFRRLLKWLSRCLVRAWPWNESLCVTLSVCALSSFQQKTFVDAKRTSGVLPLPPLMLINEVQPFHHHHSHHQYLAYGSCRAYSSHLSSHLIDYHRNLTNHSGWPFFSPNGSRRRLVEQKLNEFSSIQS